MCVMMCFRVDVQSALRRVRERSGGHDCQLILCFIRCECQSAGGFLLEKCDVPANQATHTVQYKWYGDVAQSASEQKSACNGIGVCNLFTPGNV